MGVKKGHNIRIPIFKNSFFNNCKIGINNVLLICYLYLNKSSTSQIVKMCGIQSESITFWIFNLRELLADSLNFSDVKIGGDQVVVEIDETKLGKRKYNRGRVVDGVWVVGGIERTPEKKCFLVEVPDRSAETIEKIISLYVLPGSIVYTDCFKSYIPACKNLNLPHFTVNHSKEFVNSDAGVCKNTIE
ncbi:hypothetical protein H311_01326 [Anncaliia algerae PRA109]|nr:hypothetical protein H311_01326 [Anncaliia algerae PRA109]